MPTIGRRQFSARQPVIEVALEIERRHSGIVRIVEPQLRAQSFLRSFVFRHHSSPNNPQRVLGLEFSSDRHYPRGRYIAFA
jgi:hypothetical protein